MCGEEVEFMNNMLQALDSIPRTVQLTNKKLGVRGSEGLPNVRSMATKQKHYR
jgi:hypothetical protein